MNSLKHFSAVFIVVNKTCQIDNLQEKVVDSKEHFRKPVIIIFFLHEKKFTQTFEESYRRRDSERKNQETLETILQLSTF